MSVPAAAERPSVLIVDDVDANLVALEALLEGLGCDVDVARSGNQALRLLLKKSYAVMLLDVQMPEMDGYEVAHHARQNPATHEVPIIFLTATHNTEENILRGYGSGAVDFLFKPINPDILRSKVRVFLELFAGRRLLAEANRQLEGRNVELRSLADAQRALAESFREAKEKLELAYGELQEAQAHLVQSAKMASLGELVAGVAHEINNPLAFVISHLDTSRRSLQQFHAQLPEPALESGLEHWQRAQTRLQEMALGLDRIRDLVLKLRAFSRLDEGERKLVSMRECVESLLTILGHRITGGIEVVTRFGEPDLLECYPGPLNQALMNLVANALDAVEDGGKIWIELGAEDGRYAIRVSDSGPGIPAEIRERVVEPFFTTKPVGKGTGLGLSITYSIVQKHEGSLVLSERPGGGAQICIFLPLSAPHAV
ncbi:MAG TPA: ATP-binding protein [Polyangiaceae bacterium]